MEINIPIQIMILDDEVEYVTQLKKSAIKAGISLIHFLSLEEGKEYFKKQEATNISGVILDVKGLISLEQKVPDENFIGKALKYFEEKHPKLPKTVLTGEADLYKSLKGMYAGTYTVFYKHQGATELLKHIKEEAKDVPLIKWSNKYPEIIEMFYKEYLNNEAKEKLFDCLSNMNLNNNGSIKIILDNIRYLLEMMLVKINRINPDIVPSDLIYYGKKENVQQKNIFRHLVDKKYLEDKKSIINNSLWNLYTTTSDKSVHYQTKRYPPTRYTAQALIFQLFDVLLWFKKIVENNIK